MMINEDRIMVGSLGEEMCVTIGMAIDLTRNRPHIAPPLIKIQDKQRLFSVHFIWNGKHVYLFVLVFFHRYVILTGQSNLSINCRVRLIASL